jgi:hypothetical protein
MEIVSEEDSRDGSYLLMHFIDESEPDGRRMRARPTFRKHRQSVALNQAVAFIGSEQARQNKNP